MVKISGEVGEKVGWGKFFRKKGILENGEEEGKIY